jgi:hypothetical protein
MSAISHKEEWTVSPSTKNISDRRTQEQLVQRAYRGAVLQGNGIKVFAQL